MKNYFQRIIDVLLSMGFKYEEIAEWYNDYTGNDDINGESIGRSHRGKKRGNLPRGTTPDHFGEIIDDLFVNKIEKYKIFARALYDCLINDNAFPETWDSRRDNINGYGDLFDHESVKDFLIGLLMLDKTQKKQIKLSSQLNISEEKSKSLSNDLDNNKFEVTSRRMELSSVIKVIDDNFISDIVESESIDDFETIKKGYLNVNGRADTVMRAVCCKISLIDESLIQQIIELSKEKHITFLMADGGTGKTTLLCQTAVYMHEKGVITLYSNLESQSHCEGVYIKELDKIIVSNHAKKVILIIDNPNAELISNLCVYIKDKRFKKHNCDLKIIISDRTENILNFLGELDNTYWRNDSTPVYLSNLSASDNNIKFLEKVFNKEITEIPIPIDHKKKIIDNFISNNENGLDNTAVNEAISGIEYHASITDIIVSFKLKYNEIAKESKLPEEQKYDFDWDLWEKKTKQLDANCSNIPISEAFVYIATLGVIGIQMSLETLMNIVGLKSLFGLYRLFPEGTFLPVCISNDIIRFKHDDVAKNFFFVNSRYNSSIKPQKYLIEIIKNHGWLSSQDFARVMHFAFHSARFIKTTIIPHGIDINEIILFLDSNSELKNRIDGIGKGYSLELSKISLQSIKSKEFDFKEAINESFVSLRMDIYSREFKVVWFKYFIAALYNCDELPECFSQFNTKRECIVVTDVLTNIFSNDKIKEDDILNNRLQKWGLIIFKHGLELFPDDLPMVFALGDIYEERLQFSVALKLYENYLQNPNCDKDSTHKIYTKVLRNHRLQFDAINKSINHLSKNKKNPKYRKCIAKKAIVKSEMLNAHKLFLSILKDELADLAQNELEYNETLNYWVSVSCQYAQKCISLKEYDEAYRILQDVPDETNESYRKYTYLACLYQNRYNIKANKYTNIQKTIDSCEKALSYFENYESDKTIKKRTIPILLILMNTYDIIGDKENTIRYAKIIYNLQKNNRHVRPIFDEYGIDVRFCKEWDVVNDL